MPPPNVAESDDVCPWSMVGGVPEGAFTERAGFTVRTAVLELARLLGSPGYAACITGLPAVAPVTVTEQLSGDPARLQVAMGENVTLPVPPVCDQVTVSPVIEPLSPVTVAVQVVDEATSMVTEGEQETAVLVVANWSPTPMFAPVGPVSADTGMFPQTVVPTTVTPVACNHAPLK